MQNIQELEQSINGVPLSLGVNLTFEPLNENDKTQQKLLLNELQTAREEKDQLLYKFTKLDEQLCELQEENSVLHLQNNRLQLKLSELENLEGDAVKTNQKLFELQKHVESLKDQIYKLETSRDDCLSRMDVLLKEKIELQRKQLEHQKAADEARSLKDEVDALRENADKVLKYEVAIETYKKKLEDLGNLKKHVRVLEDKNAEYLRNKLDYEEEVKRTALLKSHLEMCKNQLTEVYQKLDEQINKSENLEFEVKKFEAELEALQRERNRVVTECNTLKETNEELRCNQLITTENIMYVSNEEAVANTDFVPPSFREKLVLLEHENKVLKLNQRKESEDKLPLQALLDDAEERINDLRAQNRKANQKIMELGECLIFVYREIRQRKRLNLIFYSFTENKLEELQRSQTSESKKEQQKVQTLQDGIGKLQVECERLSAHSEENDNDLQLQKRKVIALQEQLSKKDHELSILEDRYKRYVDKAKAVIKILDPRQQVSSLTLHSLSQLRNKMNAEKKQMIEDMKQTRAEVPSTTEDKFNNAVQIDKEMKTIKEQEENMMTTAFHKFGYQKYRDIIDRKMDTTSESSAPSFMTMQRMPVPRKASTTSISSSISRFMKEYTVGV